MSARCDGGRRIRDSYRDPWVVVGHCPADPRASAPRGRPYAVVRSYAMVSDDPVGLGVIPLVSTATLSVGAARIWTCRPERSPLPWRSPRRRRSPPHSTGPAGVVPAVTPMPRWRLWPAYADRYSPVAATAGISFPRRLSFEVVEQVPGGATTAFGAPEITAAAERLPVTAAAATRMASLVTAAWSVFDGVVAESPAELRKGPRGGGRDRDKMVDHRVRLGGLLRPHDRLEAQAAGDR